MAITLLQIPDKYSFNADDMVVEVSTTQVTQVDPSFINIAFLPPGPQVGDTLAIRWLAEEVVFTIAATPDNSSLQLAPFSGGSFATYVDNLQAAFLDNFLIRRDWDVVRATTPSGIEIINFFLKDNSAIPVEVDNNWTNAISSVGQSPGTTQLKNLSAIVALYEDSGEEELVVTLQSPYDLSTGTTCFNLKKKLEVGPHLPDYNATFATADTAIKKYFFLYADKYGLPPQAEKLNQSSSFYTLHGSLSRTSDKSKWLNDPHPLALCHNYIDCESGAPFRKPIVKHQLEWLYFLATSAISVEFDARIYYNNLNTSYHPDVIPPNSFAADNLYYLATGYDQLNLDALVSDPDTVVGYDFIIKSISDNTQYIVMRYDIDCDCSDWEKFIMLDNGLGGCESVRFKGKFQQKYEGKRDLIQKAESKNFQLSEGVFNTFNAEGRHRYIANTGFYPRAYIEHLRQLLLGEVWLMDITHERYIKLIVDTKSFDIHEDDQELFALEFRCRPAYIDNHFNCF